MIRSAVSRMKTGSDWTDLRVDQLHKINTSKYNQHHELANKLKDTHPRPLIEGTADAFWGGGLHFNSAGNKRKDFTGKNVFGTILMEIRNDLLRLM